MDAHWVDTNESLQTWCERLAGETRIAVDTEANSMFAYHERICLVQVSTADTDILIDPLAVDLAPLGKVLEAPGIQKVMHGADYDVLIFRRTQSIGIANLFDTMLAARVLGWPKCGLASLLDEHFEFKANKAFQRTTGGSDRSRTRHWPTRGSIRTTCCGWPIYKPRPSTKGRIARCSTARVLARASCCRESVRSTPMATGSTRARATSTKRGARCSRLCSHGESSGQKG
ncbi:MAG: ribonuclease D [Nannocystaceae bacterium]|nr:ribonuclease D [Nannocystaceae bacterium]